MDTIDALEQAWQQGAPLVASLTADQLAAPTPCAAWDVRAMLHQTLVESGMFTRVNLGEPPHVDGEESVDFDRLPTAWADVAGANVASWRKGGLDGDRTYPFGTFPSEVSAIINLGEVVVHTWDLAVATGQAVTIDPALVSIVYGLYGAMDMTPYRSFDVFGPEVTVPADAPELDRLLALLGRQP